METQEEIKALAEELLEILYYESLNIRGVIYPNKKRFMICLNPGWGSHEAWREEWKEGEKKVQGKAIEGFTVLWQNLLKIHLCKRNETTNLKFSSELLSELSNFVTIKQTFWRRIYLLTRQLSAEEISELEVDFEQEVKTLLQKLIKEEEVPDLWGLKSTAEINVKIVKAILDTTSVTVEEKVLLFRNVLTSLKSRLSIDSLEAKLRGMEESDKKVYENIRHILPEIILSGVKEEVEWFLSKTEGNADLIISEMLSTIRKHVREVLEESS